MKISAITQLVIGVVIIPLLAACLAQPTQSALAQESGFMEPAERYSRGELTQMLAPIALYPDALLSQVLMASTYPIEVVEADRWVSRNKDLAGTALDDALLYKDWDPSVKAICHFPSILELMSERIGQTTNLGNAFLAQEEEVMDLVQELRATAYARGNLTTTSRQRVVLEKGEIIIEPADPRVIYVPYYDPLQIYGSWWYPAYQPYYWAPPRVTIGFGISFWPRFYSGFTSVSWSYFNWHQHVIYIDVQKPPRYVRHDRWLARSDRWQHAPVHRRGVVYRNRVTAEKYGQAAHIRSRGFDRKNQPQHAWPDQNRRDDDRPVIKLDNRRSERENRERGRQERVRADREQQARQLADQERQENERVAREQQVQERKSERDRQNREQSARQRAGRERTARDQQVQEIKGVRNPQEHEQPVREQQDRQLAGQERQDRLRVAGEQPMPVEKTEPDRLAREQIRQHVDQKRQISVQVVSKQQEKDEKAERDRKERERPDRVERARQQADRGRQDHDRIARVQEEQERKFFRSR